MMRKRKKLYKLNKKAVYKVNNNFSKMLIKYNNNKKSFSSIITNSFNKIISIPIIW